MSKEKKHALSEAEGLIPELRFPEFEKNGEWDRKILGEISESESSSLALNKIEHKQNGYPVYGADSIVGYIDEFQQEEKYISIVKDGSGVGRLNLCQPKSSILGTLACIKSKNSKNFNLDWIYCLMNTIDFSSYKKGSGIPHIYFSDFKNEPIGVPKPQEQQKIASCLSSLDELITAHNDKLQALKNHKKGLMQNFFPQEGETVPKLRFPEFVGDGEWKEKTIDAVSSLVTDYVANGSFQSLRENVHVNDKKGYAYYVRLVDLRAGLGHAEQKFVDKDSYKFLNKSSLHGGELLMANIGANVGEVWQMPLVDFPATLAPNMLMIKFKKMSTSDFVFHFLQSGGGQKNISVAISGSGHPKINKTDLKQVILLTPPLESEQQKIVSCLSALDELITAQSEKIEQLQQHKKGLMQGLFPKI